MLEAQLPPDGRMVLNAPLRKLLLSKLAHIRDLVRSSLNGDYVSDVVLTVPPFCAQHERNVVIDAVEITKPRLRSTAVPLLTSTTPWLGPSPTIQNTTLFMMPEHPLSAQMHLYFIVLIRI